MIPTQLLLAVPGIWSGVPYPISRLAFTLIFMAFVVAAAVLFVRWRFPAQLISEIASTLGIFLMVIGTIVYTTAFRGLRPVEMVFAWAISGIAIYWFVNRLNAIMIRPLAHLERLGHSIQRGDWEALLSRDGAHDEALGQKEFGAALKDVAELINETQRTAESVLAASGAVATIGGEAADAGERNLESIEQFANATASNLKVAGRIRDTAEQLTAAANAVHDSAHEALEISKAVQVHAQTGVKEAEQAAAAVTQIAGIARETGDRISAVREATGTIGQITLVVRDIVTQTNLLSLNAAIEAARAGESGKGFAVVADEVRKLATQSASSLENIEDLVAEVAARMTEATRQIELMDRSVADAERVATAAMDAFRGIEQDAKRTHELAASVVAASRQQELIVAHLGTASEEVVSAATNTESATKQVSDATALQRDRNEKLREMSSTLDHSAASLAAVVAKFRGKA